MRGGMVTVEAWDAGSNPVSLELLADQEIGLSEYHSGSTVAHRLDGARFAECGSALDRCVTADVLARRGVTLCWYCFPRS